MSRRSFISALVSLGTSGCSFLMLDPPFDDPIVIIEDPCEDELGGVCVGVDNQADDKVGACPCNSDAVEVADREELLAALAGPPSCIALSDGQYGAIEVGDGFELVGASVDGVVLDRLSFLRGTSSACRMKTPNVVIAGGAVGQLQYLRVAESVDDGVLVNPGGAVRIVGSTINGSARHGVSAFDVHSVSIERSLIDSDGPGIWVQCGSGCDCPARPELVVRASVLRENRVIGAAIVGADADLEGVRVTKTGVGVGFEAGGGVSVSGCSSVTASHLEVVDNADFGMLVDQSSVTLSDALVRGNLRGIWARGADLHVTGTSITENSGVGVGLTGPSVIVLEDSTVADTKTIALPVLVTGVSAGAENVGLGICWNGAAVAELRRVTVERSGERSIIIVGAANGALEDVVVPESSILQVNYIGGSQPTTSGATPPIETTADPMSGCTN